MSDSLHNASNAATAYDVSVIGGGASGLAAAITAARAGASVCVIERDVEAGLSILATGNGRCNISNTHLGPARYRYPDVARAVMGDHAEADVQTFFDGLGLLMVEEGEGRLYPVTRRAESVRDVLLGAATRAGASIRCGAKVTDARFDGAWELTVSEPATPLKCKPGHDAKTSLRNARKALAAVPLALRTIRARRVVLACGGTCGELASLFGAPHRPETPALCPVAASITGAPRALETLDGLRVHGALCLRRDGSAIWHDAGEILFRPYGISGIVAFNLSRRMNAGDSLLVDLFPQYDREAFRALLDERTKAFGAFSADNPKWFDGMLAPALANVVCHLYTACHPGETDVSHIVSICKHLKLEIAGTAEPQQAQVRRGGIPFDAVELGTLAVADAKGSDLFACGEALDMDADCGGYNLAWAWLSGIRAGKGGRSCLRFQRFAAA